MEKDKTQHPSLNIKSYPSEGDWIYVTSNCTYGLVVERTTLWEHEVFRVWLPATGAIVRVSRDGISTQGPKFNTHHLTYLAAATRVADALTHDVMLAPIESSVIPLPHQIHALSRAISSGRVRYLLADEVGLGKTIEAGLIMRELKLRGMVKRVLVIVPKGLVKQWIAEMETHFNEQFHPIMSEDYRSLKRMNGILDSSSQNPFRIFDQVIVSMDSVKPSSNPGSVAWERFQDLISAGWDLIIVDEAHRLSGSTDQVARYRLGRALSESSPYILLLSATPHQGKTDQFRRLMSLLDPESFSDETSITKSRVHPYVIRTEKRSAIDAEGKALFKPRQTELVSISWKEHHHRQKELYEAVTDYVRKGYNKAIAEKNSYIGFLMILMQRLVVSSTRAIRSTLERRLEALEKPEEQLSLLPLLNEEDWAELDGQEQVDALVTSNLGALDDERRTVELLLETARQCEIQGPDAKAEALLDWIYKLQIEEKDPKLKVLVFTEFVATQEMLYEFLTERGISAVCLNGSMSMEERRDVQERFAKEARVLISTDAGGEGLNLQFCHVVINYDMPWNPMRVEQRIGRVDRIGQSHTVRAINFVLEDSVEFRVREVLEEKLEIIFNELGIDKTADVLDSAQAENIFDDLYVKAILDPNAVKEKVNDVLQDFRKQALNIKQGAYLLGSLEKLDHQEVRKLMAHPLPHWVERMTVSYIKAYGGRAEKKGALWSLIWPDGELMDDVVFNHKDAEEHPEAKHLTMENPKVRRLCFEIAPFVPGQRIPIIALPDLPKDVIGFWSIWRISVSAKGWNNYQFMPLFLSDSGRIFKPTAKHIWDKMLIDDWEIMDHMDAETSKQLFEKLWQEAHREGESIYSEIIRIHRENIERERTKKKYVFAARRRTIERIGLPQVRSHKLAALDREERRCEEELKSLERVLPELIPLVIARVERKKHD
ncbi:MAG: hypothetical protein PWR00_931 [Thermovirga sp.]|jgi:superfamily II DNA/RNA helicase|nr:hypothetical protein [Thermovirga sp.]